MSDKQRYISALFLSAAIFVVLGFLLDRDLFSSPARLINRYAVREEATVLDSLHRYNSILTDIYVTGGVPALLNEFPATKAMRHGLFRDIGFLRDSGRILVYDMAGMYPVKVSFLSPFSAEVVLFEEWNYTYQNSSNRQPVARLRGIGQGFRYRMVRKNAAWFVSEWDPVTIEYRPKGGAR